MRKIFFFTWVFLLAACNDEQNKTEVQPAASASQGLLMGTVNAYSVSCISQGIITLVVQEQGKDRVAYQASYNEGSNYSVYLTPGPYVLMASGYNCFYNQSFQISAGQVLTISPVIQ